MCVPGTTGSRPTHVSSWQPGQAARARPHEVSTKSRDAAIRAEHKPFEDVFLFVGRFI